MNEKNMTEKEAEEFDKSCEDFHKEWNEE